MADDNHCFNITFKRVFYKKDDNGNYTILNGKRVEEEDSTKELTVTKSEVEVAIPIDKDNSFSCKAHLVYTTFFRKVYQPNEIVADICFSSDNVQDYLSFFFNAEVELVRCFKGAAQETYTGFYVYDVLPLKKQNTNLYIRFHIYSLDHQLTLKKYSRTHVAKKLLTDILLSTSNKDNKEDYESYEINKLHALLEADKDGKKKFQKFPIEVALYEDGLEKNDTNKPKLDRLYYIRNRNKDGEVSTGKKYYFECIHPYLVQYNESVYDFMVRTANRCGEFFFWDEGKLRLGRSCTDSETFNGSSCTVYYCKNTNTDAEVKSYETEYFSLDDLNREKDFETNISTRKDIDKIDPGLGDGEYQYLCFGNDTDTLNPALSTDKYYYNNEVNQDVYRTRLYRDRFDSLYHETVGNAIKYGTSFVSMLLNETSMYDFLKKFTVSNVLMTGVAAAQWGQADKFGKNHHMAEEKLDEKEKGRPNAVDRQIKEDGLLVYSNLFTTAETDGHLTNAKFYDDIRLKEEYLSGQRITFNATVPQKLRLGQTFEYGSEKKNYVIIQIKMKLGTNESKFSDIDAAAEAEFQDLAEAMQVVAIPLDGSTVYPPMHPAGHVRRSEPQIAFVADPLDPQQRGRVRIKYPWQSKDGDTEASPWIRVLTPSATPDSGCAFELVEGDEVLVEYESNNVERPYVAGTLYNKNNHTPFGRGDMALISKNGHGIAFEDPIDYSKFIAGISPSYNFVNQFLAIDTSDWVKSRRLTGGTTISDAYGFYKIELSTDQRKIDIKSPFGTVNIDAFQGINISAPNGDINIKGQNINIEAGNAIKVTSGTNISKKYYWGDGSPEGVLASLAGIAGGVMDFLKPISQIVDLDLLRKIIQVFLRPIDGTLEIKSNQYLLLEAGHGEAVVQKDRYSQGKGPFPSIKNKVKFFSGTQEKRNDANVGMRAVVQQIGVITRAAIDDIPTQQKKIAKLRVAFDATRTAVVNAGLIEQGQQCIDSVGIIAAVYNNGQPAQKNYVGADIGELHLKPTPQAGGAPPPANPDQGGIWKAVYKWASEKLTQIIQSLSGRQKAFQAELGRVEAEMQRLSNLAVNANELAQAALDYFNYIGNLVNKLTSDAVQKHGSAAGTPTFEYYGKMAPAPINAAHVNDIFTCLGASNQLAVCDLTKQQLDKAKVYIMHQWFAECLTLINNPTVLISPQTPYTFTPGPPCSDNWDAYVNNLEFKGVLDVSLLEQVANLVNGATQQYADLITDIADRTHWEAGKPGQIIFSDQAQQSYYFDRNGVTQVYENEYSFEEPTLDNMKKLLNDLN